MSFDDKSPYYSKRVRIADVKSPKEMVGFKEMTVEITYGNQETKKISNPNDFADFKEQNIFDEIEELYKQRDEWALKRGFTFIDQVNKPSKDADYTADAQPILNCPKNHSHTKGCYL